MKPYLELMKEIIDQGYDHDDRTTVGRRSVVGRQIRFPMSEGFPLVTTRRVATKAMINELLWFISGSESSLDIDEGKSTFWDKWSVSTENLSESIDSLGIAGMDDQQKEELDSYVSGKYLGSVGPIYGPNWRKAPAGHHNPLFPKVDISDIPSDKLLAFKELFKNYEASKPEKPFTEEMFIQHMYYSTVDQLNTLLLNLRDRPYSSRLVVSSWVPENIPFEALSPQHNILLDKGGLAPCHVLFQCFVKPGEGGHKDKISMLMYQRSVDMPVGAPYNISQYSLLLKLLAHVSNMEADEFIWTTGDTHIYNDQLELASEQVTREPLAMCDVWINPAVTDLFAITAEDIKIIDYESHDRIDYPVAV